MPLASTAGDDGPPVPADGRPELTDPAAFAEGVPHHRFAELRRQAPVAWQDEQDGPGYWAVTRYADCVRVNRDWESFSSYRRGTLARELPEMVLAQQRLIMLNMDPPVHTRYRRLVNRAFTPRIVAALVRRVHQIADEIIDRVVERGEADFVTDLAAELPLVVIAELLGIPGEDRRQMFEWSNALVGSADPEYQTSEGLVHRSAMELYVYASELFAEKRKRPGDDLLSMLAEVDIDGEKLSDVELELFFLLLMVAGNETTRNLVSGGMAAFFDHPDQWQLVVDRPFLVPTAVEEMLRFVTPVMHFRRQATRTVDLGGQRIEEDDKVVFFHVSANRDEEVFTQPQRFDVTRDPNPHLAFGGGGPHFCLGANLARMEARVMFEHLVHRMPGLAPGGEVRRLRSAFINGVKHLPVVFPPGPPVRG
ncbi:MAG: cytochrome P450 [Actinomycetota bacterium]|nr:cytochrome P450 [Actinomycetota bacterium]